MNKKKYYTHPEKRRAFHSLQPKKEWKIWASGEEAATQERKTNISVLIRRLFIFVYFLIS